MRKVLCCFSSVLEKTSLHFQNILLAALLALLGDCIELMLMLANMIFFCSWLSSVECCGVCQVVVYCKNFQSNLTDRKSHDYNVQFYSNKVSWLNKTCYYYGWLWMCLLVSKNTAVWKGSLLFLSLPFFFSFLFFPIPAIKSEEWAQKCFTMTKNSEAITILAFANHSHCCFSKHVGRL